MKYFTIENETKNIVVHSSAQEAESVANAERFRNEAGFAKIAAAWPMARFVEIWNSLPGVNPVTKFKDRATAVARIWKAIQNLGEAVPAETSDAKVETTHTAELASETLAEPKVAESAVAADTAPQMPHAAPEEAAAKKKASRAKRTPTEPAGAPREGSKTSQVIAMLRREGGVTLEEIMATMGWQAHSARSMLSAGGSLAKKHGLVVTSEKAGDKRVFSIKA